MHGRPLPNEFEFEAATRRLQNGQSTRWPGCRLIRMEPRRAADLMVVRSLEERRFIGQANLNPLEWTSAGAGLVSTEAGQDAKIAGSGAGRRGIEEGWHGPRGPRRKKGTLARS